MPYIRLNINGKEIKGRKGQTVLGVAKEHGIDIPTLCYDERVEVYGSCGLCVVEVEGNPRLLRACATEACDGMVIQTHTDRVKASRKTALELLLSDHVGDCKAPCILACPGNTDCQGYVGLIANGEYREALELIKEQLPLPASIGRICPHPCETACRRQLVEEPVSIAWLKSFVADMDLKSEEVFVPEIKGSTGKRVAVIGGGPGGLTAAYYLAKEGHKVAIYEAMPELGGMLRYGIPQYRLPKEVLNKEISIIEKMGVKMLTGIKVGTDVDLSYIREHFDAVYISIGAWKGTRLNCAGEELEGVIGGIEFLTKFAINQPIRTGNRIAVVGGGNTAMDACRTAIRLGAKEVYALYRRTKEEMPASQLEIKEAEEEGITFKFLVAPIEVVGNEGKVSKIRLQKMALGEPDTSGRRMPIAIDGEEEIIEVDSVIASIGQIVDVKGFENIMLTDRGTIATDEHSFITNLPGVFAGGDATNKGAGIAIEAVGDAKKAVAVIHRYLEGEVVPYQKPFYVERHDLGKEDFQERAKVYRPQMPHLSPEIRRKSFEEVVEGYGEDAARQDAMRCLECGCHDVFECKLIDYANQYHVQPERLSGEVHHRSIDDGHPFIDRNSDKCILCGLCVRVCDEVMGVGALGLIDRGFDAIVKPALDMPLKETACVSCGQCISVCPTGALQEKLKIEKSVPVKTRETPTICAYCSIGCNINLNSKGDLLIKALPVKKDTVEEGLLCVKGRFGFDVGQNEMRITKPLVRKEGVLQEVSWEEAVLYTAKKAQSLSLLYGSSSLALSISDRYTNEEIYLATQLGQKVLNTENICSFSRIAGGIKDVLGYDASTNTFDELLATDVILLIGSDIMRDHTIIGLKIKKAVRQGAKLIVINPFDSMVDEWAYKKVTVENDIVFLKEMVKSLIEEGFAPDGDKAWGFEELKKSLKNTIARKIAKEITQIYGNAKKAMIVFDQNFVTVDATKMIGNMAVVAGHIGKARSGIIQLKHKSNSQGLADLGIHKDPLEIEKAIEEGAIKGLLVFGEDLSRVDLSSLNFLMVQDVYLTETAQKADVVLPGVSFAESRGSFTSAERKIQKLQQAVPPLSGLENWQVMIKLANALSNNIEYESPDEIFEQITLSVPEYFKAYRESKTGVFWPVNSSPILYTQGYHFEDKKAKLQTVQEGKLFDKIETTDCMEKRFIDMLQKENIL